MTAAVRGYLLSITAAALLLALVQALLPQGAARRTAAMVGGLLILLTVLSPLAKLDYDSLAKSIAQLQMETETMRTGIEVGSRDLMAGIIKQRCETYILDKAGQMGLTLEVEITLSEGVDYPYPVSVTLRGAATEAQKRTLTAYITENLGIPAERQEWI